MVFLFWVKKMENPTLSGSDSGAGTAKSLSIPRLDPIFSYGVKGGNIYIYVFQSGVSKMAIATFDDKNTEFAYATQTLTTGSKYEVEILLMNAEERFNDKENNPFRTLLWDIQALSKLYRVVRSVVKGE